MVYKYDSHFFLRPGITTSLVYALFRTLGRNFKKKKKPEELKTLQNTPSKTFYCFLSKCFPFTVHEYVCSKCTVYYHMCIRVSKSRWRLKDNVKGPAFALYLILWNGPLTEPVARLAVRKPKQQSSYLWLPQHLADRLTEPHRVFDWILGIWFI